MIIINHQFTVFSILVYLNLLRFLTKKLWKVIFQGNKTNFKNKIILLFFPNM